VIQQIRKTGKAATRRSAPQSACPSKPSIQIPRGKLAHYNVSCRRLVTNADPERANSTGSGINCSPIRGMPQFRRLILGFDTMPAARVIRGFPTWNLDATFRRHALGERFGASLLFQFRIC